MSFIYLCFIFIQFYCQCIANMYRWHLCVHQMPVEMRSDTTSMSYRFVSKTCLPLHTQPV